MTGIRARSLAALMLIISLAACKKEGGDAAGLPADMLPRPAKGDPAKLVMPKLFASVPADTPYLVASAEGMPAELAGRIEKMAAPLLDVAKTALSRERGGNPLLDAILSELDGKWSAAGFESLGFSTSLRFAVYGLGLQPVVARLEVKDHKAVQATIERIAAKAGETLPAMAVKDGRSYWQYDSGGGTRIVIAPADNQLVFAVGKTADVEARLGLILGGERPAQSMADGAPIKQLMTRHGFGGQLIAYGDTRRIAGLAFEAAGAPPSPACGAVLDRMASRVPRVVFGYGELSGSKLSGGTVVELSDDAVAALRGIKVEMPGLAAALAGHPLFAMAAAVDLPGAQQLAIDVAGSFRQLGEACALGSLADGADRAARAMAKPLPAPVGQITGGAVIVDEIAFPAGGPSEMPSKLSGVALVASRDGRALFDKLAAMQAEIKSLGIVSDGKLHDIQLPMPLPFVVSVGVGDRALVATTGAASRQSAERLLAAHGGGKVPLLAMSYDVGRFLDLTMHSDGMRQASSADPALAATMQTMDKIAAVFGRTAGAIDVTDHGLALWSTVELK